MNAASSHQETPGRGIRVVFAGVEHWHFSVDARYLELAREAEVEIVGLSDDSEALARRRGEELGCGWTTDLDELVTRFKPDLVIALPRPDRAAEQVGRLIGLGVPLFAEKPLGLNAGQVWPLVAPSERTWVTVAFCQRYSPFWQAYERLRDAGVIGPIGHAGVRQVAGPPHRYLNRDTYNVPWMLDPEIAGGGPLRNIGVHGADMLMQIVGDQQITVAGAARTESIHHVGIEDFICGTGIAPGGAVVSLAAGYTYTQRQPGDSDIHLAARDVYVNQRNYALTVQPANGPAEITPRPEGLDPYRELFFDALRRLRAGAPPVATVRDCARANTLVDAIYAAAS